MKQLIGITGFKTRLELGVVYKTLLKQRNYKNFQLHAGVMMSEKTLKGVPSRWTGIWPTPEQIADLFVRHTRIYNCVHIVASKEVAQDYERLKKYVTAVCDMSQHIHAIQFDMYPPNVQALVEINSERIENGKTPLEFIIQIGKEVFTAFTKPYDIVSVMLPYVQNLELQKRIRVLLDMSEGKGEKLNADFLLPYIKEIKMHLGSYVDIVVAGGLCAETTEVLAPILRGYPNISVDAEQRLHVDNNLELGLNLDACCRYIEEICKIYNKEEYPF